MAEPACTIGDLSRATGVKVATIRFYEKIGLLNVPARSGANYRLYTQEDRARLRFIRRCRELGFSLEQTAELAGLSASPGCDCTQVDAVTVRHLAHLRQRIADLAAIAAELEKLGASCRGGGPVSACRILEALER